LTDVDADELVGSGKVGKLVRGFRGNPPADARAVADVVLRVARLVDDLPEIAELDLNPVIAGPDGCVVVDARVRVGTGEQTRSAKTW
jgi:acyl-CoA synthetase (NDP forming)